MIMAVHGHLQGKIASDYKLVRKLSARVCLVDFKEKGALYAAKIIDLEKNTDNDIENEFKGIRFGKTLRHHNLLPFITAFVDKSDLWIITPYCDAGSAGELCQPTGFEEPVMAMIVQDVLYALEYLHDRGIVHRGIKGSHLLLRKCDGRCLLSGFNCSISIIEDGKLKSSLHEYPKKVKDNLNWFAPEILEQNLLGYDTKSDIYSLGVTCCELANGAVPYDNMEATEILLDKLTGNHPKPIDMTCTQFVKVPEGMTQQEEEQYETYKRRRFTDSFHSFVVSLCLNPDPVKRPSATQLLSHGFLKQARKSSTGVSLPSFRRPSHTKSDRSPLSSPPNSKKSDDLNDVRWSFE